MIKIYVNYFGPARVISNSVLIPIQVGSAIAKHRLDMLGDDQGENISTKNPFYCELTGQYWAWKNDRTSEYVGFFHYRRFLDFLPNSERTTTVHGVVEKSFPDDFLDKFGLTQENIEEVVVGFDAIVPEPIDVRDIKSRSVWDQYCTAQYHHIADLQATKEILSELYPDDLYVFNRVMEGTKLYPTNIFVFSRLVFEEYCEWLFSILEELESRVNVDGYGTQERRVIGYIAERLLTVFIAKKTEQNEGFKIKTLRRVLVENTTPPPETPRLPVTDLPILPIVASTDAAYLPQMAVLITSVLSNVSQNRFVDFIVLDGGLLEADRLLLSKLASLHPHCSIRFVGMSGMFLDLPLHSYFTRSTYYRLAIPELFKDYDKLLFLDTDMVVNGDVTDLFDVDLGDNAVAAVKDLIMSSFVSMGVRALSDSGKLTAKAYLAENLQMGDKVSDYFQAGTLVFNLTAMRKTGVSSKMIKDLSENRYWFLDQDVLNKYLFGSVKFLPTVWNTVSIDDEHFTHLTNVEKDIYNESQQNPKIVHYAGQGKPWVDSKNRLSHYYWSYLRQTPWYEEVLFQVISNNLGVRREGPFNMFSKKGIQRSMIWRVTRFGWSILPRAIKSRLLPLAEKVSIAIK